MAALRGAATLKARLEKGLGATTIPTLEEKCGVAKEANILTALDCVFRGGVLLKRTRKGMSSVYCHVCNNDFIEIEE